MFWSIDNKKAVNDDGESNSEVLKAFLPGFLDLFIKAENNQFSIRKWDKRDDFLFSKKSLTYLRRNISSNMHNSSYGSEILKTVRLASFKLIF